MTEKLEKDNKVQPISVGHLNIYLIKTDQGYILVDTGMPNMKKKLEATFQKSGVEPENIQLIILTHGHLDHVGCAAYAQEITGGKILCHRSIITILEKGKFEPAVPQNFFGRVLDFITGFLGSNIEAVTADIPIDEEFDLSKFGVSGRIIHTPGHSQSSISILLDNGEALVGDLVREEKPGVIGLGMFYEDKETALESAKKIVAQKPRTIYLSHGSTIDNNQLNAFITTN